MTIRKLVAALKCRSCKKERYALTANFGASPNGCILQWLTRCSVLSHEIAMCECDRGSAWGGGFPIKVNGEIVGAIGLSGAPTVQNDIDCARAALALVSDAVPVE